LGFDRDLLGKEMRTAAAGRRDPKMTAPAAASVSSVEKALLRYLVIDPEGRTEVLPLVVKLFTDLPALAGLPTRAIFLALGNMTGDDPISPVDVSALEDRLTEVDRQRLASILHDDTVEPLTLESARGCADDLARRPIEARIQELKGLIRKAEESGGVQEALKLLQEKRELEKRLETGKESGTC
jgi:hypothetical protein